MFEKGLQETNVVICGAGGFVRPIDPDALRHAVREDGSPIGRRQPLWLAAPERETLNPSVARLQVLRA